jgi:hypothetical protein
MEWQHEKAVVRANFDLEYALFGPPIFTRFVGEITRRDVGSIPAHSSPKVIHEI